MTSLRTDRPEVLVSIDIEASGPTPANGALLAIGACLVERPEAALYLELQPPADAPWDPDAARIHRLDRARLEREGLPPAEAAARLERWLHDVAGDATPVFVGLNAGFDWMFIADLVWRELGHNPFGHAPLDLKALYMGRDHVTRWAATGKGDITQRYPVTSRHTHHALEDARMQAELARQLFDRPDRSEASRET
ncbi:MAG: 3'-5' exonuclease [Chloroflexi bacterium]|nr:3'-5' exonuclease [Chloroflexota bacterium]